MKKKSTSHSARVLVAQLVCGAACSIAKGTLPTTAGKLAVLPTETPVRVSHPSAAGLTFAERVTYQRAIEEVNWRHRIWPKENSNPKPSLNAVISQTALEKKVQDYLRDSQTLEDYWHRAITAQQLQAEMNRMAQNTKQPEVLRELFEALGNDPFVIAECLARPVLTERLLNDQYERADRGRGQRTEVGLKESSPVKTEDKLSDTVTVPNSGYSLPTIADGANGCSDDTWAATSLTNVPTAREYYTAVWTGTEMIVWGGYNGSNLNTGGRYNPSTDSWTATSTANAPIPRYGHTAVWTGSEIIVWAGVVNPGGALNTGGRYNPTSDSWIATSITNAPSARGAHTAVWTGSEMIVWGGGWTSLVDTGGKYNPNTNSWTATSTYNAPSSRYGHTAVWTGSEMIVWGGSDGYEFTPDPVTGGRYNPSTNSWTATTTANAPSARSGHTAVWTGSEMIVWGGLGVGSPGNTGGKYNPATNNWVGTSTANAPSPRDSHKAVWTGSEMIVWGGCNRDVPNHNCIVSNTGGRYCGQPSIVPPRLDNISTRAFVQTGDNVMIGGFIVQGTEPKRVIIRAIGPELTQHGVPNALANPTLELHNRTGALIASNNNWRTTIIGGIITSDQVVDILRSGHAPSDGRESAIIADLPPGSYTAIVRGVNDSTGVALAEVYDLGSDTNSILGNISTRSFVQTGDNVMIGGFIVQGTQPKRVILRAIGPELGAPPFNIPNALTNPTLELHNGAGALIASNDNWRTTIIGGIITANQVRDIVASGYAPRDGRESAIIADLPPGNYTAIVRGVNNTTGVALVEVYDFD